MGIKSFELKFEQIIDQIKKGNFSPLYYLYGNELWHIEKILEAIEANALQESEKSFNMVTNYGKETSFKSILDFARRYPVMAQRQLMIVKGFQALGDMSPLLSYFEKPVESTILVMVSNKSGFDKRTKAYKTLSKTGVVFESKALYENQIPTWIEMYLKSVGEQISPDATRLLAEYMGTDLKNIENALRKLIIAKEEGEKITLDLVEKITGINREYNVFMLQKCLSLDGDDKIIQMTDRMAEDVKSNPMPLVIGSLFSYFSKVYALHSYPSKNREAATALGFSPFFLSEYVSACKRFSPKALEEIFSILLNADLRSKGVGSTGDESADQMKELIGRILIAKEGKVLAT